ncbi:MAG TPA: type II secretion system protein M [Burkholderiales bacterium]|nr:type II secretion system protein M [Burkholderiales bacterium]
MKAQLLKLWESRSPRERTIIAAAGVVLGIFIYVALVQTATRARIQLRSSVLSLRAQANSLEQQAVELERVRAAPPLLASQTDLRTLVQSEAAAAGLSRSLVSIDALDANQVAVVFGAVAFADWHNWIVALNLQQVRVDACRIEAMSTPGLVSITATLARAKPK